jgi:hypothetical protein
MNKTYDISMNPILRNTQHIFRLTGDEDVPAHFAAAGDEDVPAHTAAANLVKRICTLPIDRSRKPPSQEQK